MKGVILAAGVGLRLRPLTEGKPKCMVKVAGRAILDYQVRAYAQAGITDIIIVAGYKTEQVRRYCDGLKDLNITIIENKDYETTNNMYSLYLAGDEVRGRDFFLSNGDVVLDESIIADMAAESMGDLVAAQPGNHNVESMKISVNPEGYICDISKTIAAGDAYGTSITVYRFSKDSSEVLFEQVTEIVESQGNRNEWTELAIQRLVQSQALKMVPFDIGGRNWVEIDDYDDLLAAERLFSECAGRLFDKKLFFIDLDGTVYMGDNLIPGADRFLARLKEKGIPYYFLSNNSSRSKVDYVKKLNGMGIDVDIEKMILSTDGLLEFLKTSQVKDVFVVGTESMEGYIAEAGIETRSSNPEYVVLGYDTELTYEKLRKASIYLINGVGLLATHKDIVCPTPEGPVPDVGAMLALFEKATNVKPLKIFGKPNKEMISHVMKRHNVTGKDTVIVGDRLYTDMELARKSDACFMLVLSGETKREDVEDSGDWPEVMVKSLGMDSLTD